MPAHRPDPERLAALLRRIPRFAAITPGDLVAMPHKGISNDHYRIHGHAAVLRLPRFSQWSQAADVHFAYQRAAFDRAQPSGHTPRLIAALPPGGDIIGGALVVSEIVGRPPDLPDDLAAIAHALAAIHNLPVPAAKAPLLCHTDPFRDTLAVIETQAPALTSLDPAHPARIALSAELDWARGFTVASPIPTPVLTGTDTHPGNFLIDSAAKAWFVDLEKAIYGSPAIDLAHATLPTSVGWDPDCAADVSPAAVDGFYTTYLSLIPTPAADALRPWLTPLRRLTWLRTMTWFVRWHVDWSNRDDAAAQSQPIADHIARHIETSLSPAAIAATRAQWL